MEDANQPDGFLIVPDEKRRIENDKAVAAEESLWQRTRRYIRAFLSKVPPSALEGLQAFEAMVTEDPANANRCIVTLTALIVEFGLSTVPHAGCAHSSRRRQCRCFEIINEVLALVRGYDWFRDLVEQIRRIREPLDVAASPALRTEPLLALKACSGRQISGQPFRWKELVDVLDAATSASASGDLDGLLHGDADYSILYSPRAGNEATIVAAMGDMTMNDLLDQLDKPLVVFASAELPEGDASVDLLFLVQHPEAAAILLQAVLVLNGRRREAVPVDSPWAAIAEIGRTGSYPFYPMPPLSNYRRSPAVDDIANAAADSMDDALPAIEATKNRTKAKPKKTAQGTAHSGCKFVENSRCRGCAADKFAGPICPACVGTWAS